jgi:hypothetical protein
MLSNTSLTRGKSESRQFVSFYFIFLPPSIFLLLFFFKRRSFCLQKKMNVQVECATNFRTTTLQVSSSLIIHKKKLHILANYKIFF